MNLYRRIISRINSLIKCYVNNIPTSCRIGRCVQIIGSKMIVWGGGCSVGSYSVVSAWSSYFNQKFHPQIVFGKNVHLGEYCHITAINNIIIDDNVLTGRRCTISDNSHGSFDKEELIKSPVSRPLYSKGPVKIGRNVWIGDNVVILPGVEIGESAIIGAGSIVTKNIPAFSIAVGNPAKVIKKLT